jgi:hypothetical protein
MGSSGAIPYFRDTAHHHRESLAKFDAIDHPPVRQLPVD